MKLRVQIWIVFQERIYPFHKIWDSWFVCLEVKYFYSLTGEERPLRANAWSISVKQQVLKISNFRRVLSWLPFSKICFLLKQPLLLIFLCRNYVDTCFNCNSKALLLYLVPACFSGKIPLTISLYCFLSGAVICIPTWHMTSFLVLWLIQWSVYWSHCCQ